jgi:hypothetical protein
MLEHWPQWLQIGFLWIKFPALGLIQGHKVQHLLVTWGQIENIFYLILFFFYFSLVTTSVK